MRRVLPLALLLTGCRPDVVSHDLGVKFSPPKGPATFPVERPITMVVPNDGSKLKLEVTTASDTLGVGLERIGPDGSRDARRVSGAIPEGLPAPLPRNDRLTMSSTVEVPKTARGVIVETSVVRIPRDGTKSPHSESLSPNFVVDKFPSKGWERRVELIFTDAAGKKIPPKARRPW